MNEPSPHLSLADLAAAGRRLPVSFILPLAGGSAGTRLQLDPGAPVPVVVTRVFRLLPGRRLVARVEVGGSSALMKLFLGRHAGRYRDREVRGSALLERAGVPTPARLGTLQAPPDEAGACAVLFEYLPEAAPLTAGDPSGVIAAAQLLARLHGSGGVHRDLHLGNFLATPDGAVYLVDGDGVRRNGNRPLGKRASLKNLAVLCAQCPPLADDRLDAVHRAYAAERGWPGTDARELTSLAVLTRRARRARVRRYLHKARRDCTEFLVRRSPAAWVVGVREHWDDAVAAFADDPEAVFPGARMLKDGNSATVVRVRLGKHWRVIKRYNVKGPWHALRRNLRLVPRFRRAWLNGQRLHLLEIPTARPLALVEQRAGIWRGVAYLVMEDLGDEDLAGEVGAVGLTDRRLAQVTSLFRALDAAELTHGDTKASNFLVTPSGVALVDLDAMHDGQRGAEADRRRFLANFDRQPEVRERFRSALAAAGRGGFAAAPRSL